MASSAAVAAEVPQNLRKSSNASSGMESDNTGRFLNSLGSIGSGGLGDDGATDLPDLPKPDLHDENEFQVPASVPQHQLKLPADDSSLHVTFTSLQNPLEENASLTSSKGSRIPERRLPTKKRKMSYESYDSAMGDSYLGLASLDSGALPKAQPDGASVNTKGSGASGTASRLPNVSALEHLDALGDEVSASIPAPEPVLPSKSADKGKDFVGEGGVAGLPQADDNSEATFSSNGHRLLMEAIMMTGGGSGGLDSGGRKRLESWGGMSDLSFQMGPDHGVQQAAAAIAASALHHTGIIDDVTAAANFGGGSVASSVTDEHILKPSASADIAAAGRERGAWARGSAVPRDGAAHLRKGAGGRTRAANCAEQRVQRSGPRGAASQEERAPSDHVAARGEPKAQH